MVPALVVFDLVGTTAEDQPHIARALQRSLSEEGIAVGPADISRLRGGSKREAIASLVPPDAGHVTRSRRVYERFYRQLLEAYAADPPRTIPGVLPVFEDLRRRDIRIALNTGFERDLAHMILDRLDWPAGTCDAVVCGDDVACGRPSPDLIFKAMELTAVADTARVANVGDTANDLLAGSRAGVRWNIGVLTGAHRRDTLAAAPHTHLVTSIADVPSAILRRPTRAYTHDV